MKRKIKFLLFAACLFMLPVLAFTACSGGTAPDGITFEMLDFTYSEPHSNITQSLRGHRAYTGYADYYFSGVGIEDRLVFMEYAEELLEYLHSAGFPYAELELDRLTFFTTNNFYTRADSYTNSVFVRFSDIRTVRFINFTLQAIAGETANYGLLHGLSVRIFEDLGWDNEINNRPRSNEDIADFLQDEYNRFVLHLTFGVFHPRFSTAGQIEYAKSISARLVDYIIKNNTNYNILFTAMLNTAASFNLSFGNMFYGLLNQYLYYINTEQKPLPSQVFKNASFTYDFPIILATHSVDYLIHREWDEERIQDWYPFTFGDFEPDYSSLKNFFLDREPVFEKIREFFKWEDFKRVPARMMRLPGNILGYAPWHTEYVAIESILAMTHEYAHFVNIKALGARYSWLIEALAWYCDVVFDSILQHDMKHGFINREYYADLFGPVTTRGFELYYKVFKPVNPSFSLVDFWKARVYVSLFENNERFDLHNLHHAFAFVYFLFYTHGREAVFYSFRHYGSINVFVTDTYDVIKDFKAYLYAIFNPDTV